jgi:hypothetical protein
MWLIYDDLTGAQVGDWHATEPTPGQGQSVARVPGSAKTGESAWIATKRAFMDVPLMDGPRLLQCLTAAEITAATTNPATIPVVLQYLLLLVSGKPQRINSPMHIGGAAALFSGSVLTQERYDEFLMGQPPQ